MRSAGIHGLIPDEKGSDVHHVLQPFGALRASLITNCKKIRPTVTSAAPTQSTRLSTVETPSGGTKKKAARAMANVRDASVHRQALHVYLR